MNKPVAYTIYPVNENTLTISLGDAIDDTINQNVFQIYHQLLVNRHETWTDVIPAYTTVSIVYDVAGIREKHTSAFDWVAGEVEKVLAQPYSGGNLTSRKVSIPVCYEEPYALDRKMLLTGSPVRWDEIVSLHSSKTYRVFMIGFLPGFAYMGLVDQKIAFPRLAKPRTWVPAGSIGIAGGQTGIYPLDSPGGWNIIGRTPVSVFDINNESPVLLRPHDQVTFLPITRNAFESFDKSAFNPLST